MKEAIKKTWCLIIENFLAIIFIFIDLVIVFFDSVFIVPIDRFIKARKARGTMKMVKGKYVRP